MRKELGSKRFNEKNDTVTVVFVLVKYYQFGFMKLVHNLYTW